MCNQTVHMPNGATTQNGMPVAISLSRIIPTIQYYLLTDVIIATQSVNPCFLIPVSVISQPPFQPSGQDTMPPNNILFIHNLPIETNSMMLQLLFEQYPGFKEIRMIEAKPGIAFVEYEDDVQSSMAMQALQGFKITPQNPMVVSFAKK